MGGSAAPAAFQRAGAPAGGADRVEVEFSRVEQMVSAVAYGPERGERFGLDVENGFEIPVLDGLVERGMRCGEIDDGVDAGCLHADDSRIGARGLPEPTNTAR